MKRRAHTSHPEHGAKPMQAQPGAEHSSHHGTHEGAQHAPQLDAQQGAPPARHEAGYAAHPDAQQGAHPARHDVLPDVHQGTAPAGHDAHQGQRQGAHQGAHPAHPEVHRGHDVHGIVQPSAHPTRDHAHQSPHRGRDGHRTMEPGAHPTRDDAHQSPHRGHGHSDMVADFRIRFFVSLVLTVPILVLSPMIQQWFGLGDSLRFRGDLYVVFFLSSAVFVYGGYPFLKGLVDELRLVRPGMMTLIAVAITTAYLYSSAVVFGLGGKIFFWELATLIDIMLLGHWIEMKSVMGASRALEEIATLMPSAAHQLLPDGTVEDVPLSSLKVGDRVLVKPGEKIPADGGVVAGESSVNESMLTGESTPVPKKNGSKVIGGSINGEDSITIDVSKTGADSFLSQVVALVKEAQESKSKTQDLANRAALWLTIIALAGGAITLFLWYGVMNRDFAFALERTVTVMVITCPHALGLAIPLVVAVSTALSVRNGFLIRNRAAFERARNIQAVIFDKTGTLTEGRFGITDIVALSSDISSGISRDVTDGTSRDITHDIPRDISDDIDEKELLKYVCSVEALSEHPIAKGILYACSDRYSVGGFRAIPGKGAEGRVNGREVKVVSSGYLKEQNISVDDRRIENLSSQGKTVVFVVIDGALKGFIALGDVIRPESQQAISLLKGMGIKCMMLTGDNRCVAKWVSEELELDDYFAEVLPQEKAEKVKEVQSRGLMVAMTGDGVNDAPALAKADVGIAIGAGTDVAIETADIVLVRSNPLDVVAVIRLARATYSKMAQNLAWATGYNAFAIPLAAGVLYRYGILLTPAAGAILMTLSTVIVAVNARRLRLA